MRAFFLQGHGKLSVIMRCPCYVGVCKAGFHCNNNDNDDCAVALPTSVYLIITKMIMITKIIITITKFSSLIGYQLDSAIGQYASCLLNSTRHHACKRTLGFFVFLFSRGLKTSQILW